MFIKYIYKKRLKFEQLHSVRSKMKKWDLQNNFDLTLLISNVSNERMCRFLMLKGLTMLLHLTTFY